jgi:hypothetical protein
LIALNLEKTYENKYKERKSLNLTILLSSSHPFRIMIGRDDSPLNSIIFCIPFYDNEVILIYIISTFKILINLPNFTKNEKYGHGNSNDP